MYLITKWFGVFLFKENNELIKKILFIKKPNEIQKKISKINQGEILKEEKEILDNVDSVYVCEKRLRNLGSYKPDQSFFKKTNINYVDYGFDISLLRKATVSSFEEKMKEKLSEDDLQIIQMVDSLDDLKKISNLLLERIEACEEVMCDKMKISPLVQSHKTIENQTKELEKKIKDEMQKTAPNLSFVAGSLIGARLISQAGGLRKLAFLPSSTIQVLGAEKALFRYKKEGGKPPKHGVIFQNPKINRAQRDKRGKLARSLASKISIAARADAFTKNIIYDRIE